MTPEEFDLKDPTAAHHLRSFTGHYLGGTKDGNWFNARRRMDITGVYEREGGGWWATIEHVVGDSIATEIAEWTGTKWIWEGTKDA